MFPLNNIDPWMHDVYMREALKEAQAAEEKGEVPVGAVIVCKDKIIARGHNLTQTLTDVTAHAEMQAITAAADWLGGKYLPDCVIYVTVEPCLMCAAALGWAQIGAIVFGTPDTKKGFLNFYAAKSNMPSPLHPKTQLLSGVLEEECAEMMREFFKNRRR